MIPITGPISTQESNGALPGPSFYEEQSRYGQKPPYDLALPYRVYRRNHGRVSIVGANPPQMVSINGFLASGSQGNEDTWAYRPTSSKAVGLLTDVLNKARTKALATLGDTASWGENIGEYKSAASMMQSRLYMLKRAQMLLRSGNALAAVKALNIPPDVLKKYGNPGRPWSWKNMSARHIARHWSSIWLELHFGWSPLLQDIYNSTLILESEVTGHFGESSFVHTEIIYKVSGDDSTGLPNFIGKHNVAAWARVTAGWRIKNPNLYLANRMGIVNPATIAWNLSRLSWFVDWIANVSAFLNNWSDLLGIELVQPCYTNGFKDVCESQMRSTYRDVLQYDCRSTTQSLYCQRYTGFPSYTLRVKNPFYRISLTRGLTAVSYLISKGIKASVL